ncbi:MAG: phosphoribosyltransferase family protein [Sphingobacteriales bacterium]|nr:phosphoribosyltransferase family protein [Sphingobacteriales bacterium]
MILDKETAQRKLRRMALEISEKNYDKNSLLLIGIKSNGIFIAKKIAEYLKESFTGTVELLEMTVNKKNPIEISLDKQVDFNGKSIILIDDVANSGRVMLYALKPLIEQLPAQIETLVLVERTHKKFPIDVNYVGLSIATTNQENIVVDVQEGEVMGASLV